jgi:hypothetical protein
MRLVPTLALMTVLAVWPARVAAETPTGAAFVYQGRLEGAGTPYTGSADIQFSLWDAATSPPGSQVGATQNAINVSVVDGLFTQAVDFGPFRFDGHARWLQIAVRTPSGVGFFTTLTPRQPIAAAPYAASLALPCEAISENDSNDAFTIMQSADHFSAGVFGILSSTSIAATLRAAHNGNGPAVAGLNQHAGINFGWLGTPLNGVYGNSQALDGVAGVSAGPGKSGVYGETSHSSGYGVFGRNALSGNFGFFGSGAAGAYGSTANAANSGGYFENLSSSAGGANAAGVTAVSTAGIGVSGSTGTGRFGVYGKSQASSGLADTLVGAGVLGDSSTNDGVTGICSAASRSGVSGYAQNAGGGGVYGANLATNNYGVIGGFEFGVYGLSSNGGHGVAGYSTATTGQNSGVHGETSSAQGFGVYGTVPTNSGIPLPFTGGGVMGDSGSGDGVVGFSSALSGVYGLSSAPGGAGVYGSNYQTQNYGAVGTPGAGAYGVAVTGGGTGVFGQAFGVSGTNYGVYGRSDSPAGYGGYFVGRGYFSNDVGIGIEQSTVPLQVVGGGDASLAGGGNIVVGQISGPNVVFDNNEIMARNNGAAANLYLNVLGGNVGIATNNPQGFTLAVAGTAAKTNGGSWSTLSDARVKKNIRDLPAGSLDKLLALRGHVFEYLPEAIQSGLATAGEHVGFVAQEVERVLPEWVETNASGTKFISERGTTALLVEALRELRVEKDRQLAELRSASERQIASKDAELAAVRARLERLEEAASYEAERNVAHH